MQIPEEEMAFYKSFGGNCVSLISLKCGLYLRISFSMSLYNQQYCSTILHIYIHVQVTTCEHVSVRVTTTSERYRVMLIRK